MAKKYTSYKRPHYHSFYNSKLWRKTRELYILQNGGYCENCLKKGEYVLGKILHHKEHINNDNYNDIKVLTDFNNLEMLCQECHNNHHHKKNKITRDGSRFNSNGKFIIEKEDEEID